MKSMNSQFKIITSRQTFTYPSIIRNILLSFASITAKFVSKLTRKINFEQKMDPNSPASTRN